MTKTTVNIQTSPEDNFVHKQGNVYLHIDTTLYLLSALEESRVVLIGLQDGNYYSSSVIVDDTQYITEREFMEITSYNALDFTPVSEVQIEGKV